MNSYLMQTVCRTGIFVICAQVLIHFRPDASYEKYMKMLVSAIILIQLFLPVSNLFAGEKEQSLAERAAWFEEQMELSMRQAAQRYSESEEILTRMTLEEVRERLDKTVVPQTPGSDVDSVQKIEPIKIQVPKEWEGGAGDGKEGREGDQGGEDGKVTESLEEMVSPG